MFHIDEERSDILWHHLEQIAEERTTRNTCEIRIGDWDECAWEEELECLEELIDPQEDLIVFWHVEDGEAVRSSIGSRC